MARSIALLAALVALPLEPGVAQTDDATYCRTLGELATRYLGKRIDGATKPDVDTLIAIDRCQKGDTATGIAMLEKKLVDGGFSLPKRS
jgi:hypothetical protein